MKSNISADKQLGIYLLFFSVILAWGLSWPVTKIGLHYITPLWLAVLRQAIAAIVLFIYLIATRQFRIPPRQDIPIVLSGGILFAGLFVGLINLGLLYVHAGRAAILAYTTPFWIIVLSRLFLKRTPSREQLLGFFFGILGIAILFNPLSFTWSDYHVLIGNGLLLLAAFCWAVIIIHAREHRLQNTPLQNAPWQMAIAVILLSILAMIYEPHAKIIWSKNFFIITLFLGIIASAYGHVISFVVSKKLPSVTTSLGFLGVPITSLIVSAFMLGEKITGSTSLAIILILIGLAVVVMGDLKRRKINR
jgi:drug/metabolite transporter (DMT)-like permease